MQLRLLEIELHTNDPEASQRFYGRHLGLETRGDADGLKVFGSGIPNLHLIKSPHFPGKISISFYADDVPRCLDELKDAGIEVLHQFGDPVSAIVLSDPDGCRVEIKQQSG